MSLIEWLDAVDKNLFIIIQNDTDQPILDKVMPVLRNPLTWIPFYIFMLYFGMVKGKTKTLFFIILSILTFIITDNISAQILKPLFARPRPCYDAQLHSFIRSLVDCGGLYSFPSSHATNHFGLAAFWYWSVKQITNKKWTWLWLWAFAISYAQIYVGKHYPFDIVAGAAIGTIIGSLMAKIFEYFWYADININNFINRRLSQQK